MTDVTLPAWARRAETQMAGRLDRYDVDADAMYRAWLAEFAAAPPRPTDFPGRRITQDGQVGVIPPMTPEEAICDPERPTQYWLECAHQCMKLELQVVLRRFNFEIRTHSATKRFAHAAWPAGRGALAATKGFEAKAHFRRLRGVLPA